MLSVVFEYIVWVLCFNVLSESFVDMCSFMAQFV